MTKLTIYLAALTMVIALSSSCKSYQAELDEEQKKAQLLNEQLTTLEEEQKLINGEYADAMDALNEIDQTLNEMAARNKEMDALIQQKDLAKGTNQEQVIMAKLQSLQSANKEADQKARRLRTKLKAYKVENSQLKKMVAQLETKFIEVETEVNKVQTTIANMQIALNKLEADVSATETELSAAYADLKVQTDKLETTNKELETTLKNLQQKNEFIGDDAKAYIACGSRKVLRQNKIIRLLSAKTLTPEYQTQVKKIGSEIDFYNNDQIDCGEGEILFLLPNRDPNSYKIEGGRVTVLDQKTFWSTAKTVVLVKK